MAYISTIRRFAAGVLFALPATFANGQTTQINTAYTNTPGVNILAAKPGYVSFTVKNANSYAIAIREIGNMHIASATIAGSPVINYSQNGCRYALWYSESSTAAVPIDPMSGWIFADSSQKISTNANGVVQVITGMKDVIIAPNSTYKFVLVSSDSIAAVGNTGTPAAPGSFTTNNVTLSTVGLPWGLFPNNSQQNGQAFNGNVVFEKGIPKPDIAITPNQGAYCLNDSVTLIASAESYIANPSFTWKYNGVNIGTGNTYTLPGGLTTATAGKYTCTVTDGTLTSNEAVVDVTYTDPPAPTIAGKLHYCLNEQFQQITINGADPKWYYVPNGGSPLPVAPTINTSSPNSLTYYVTQTVNGCESSVRTLVNFTAARKPAVPIVTSPIYYCEEAPADQLYAFGDNLKWYYSPVSTIHTEIAPTPNTSKLQKLDYYVTQTVNGCESDRSKIDVVVTFKPNGLILADKKELCANEELTLGYYGSAYPTSQYNWVLPDKGTTILNGGYDQGPLVIRLDTPGQYQVKLRVGNTGCLSDEYTQKISVKPLPYANISTKTDACLGQDILIASNNYTKGLDTFNWDFDGGLITHEATEQGAHGVYWATAGEKNIKVTVVDNGCTSTTTETVTVHQKPSATIVAEGYTEGDIICASDSLKVNVDRIEPNATYKWSPERFFDTYSGNAVSYARVDFDSRIYVEVEDIYGCTNKDSLMVTTKPCCEMTFPTAFTPNGDSRNDLFRPITIGNREVKSFRIVNRYGQTIFETANAHTGWDGRMNGKPADVGTYFYLISFKCGNETINQSGEVILVR